MSVTTKSLPHLESGDRLPRAEFHRRYCARPDIKKAELVGGVVYVASPTRHEFHAKPHGMVVVWAGTYAARRGGIELGNNGTVFLGPDDEVQPDVTLFRLAPLGAIRATARGYLEGTPDLAVEIAASSASYDLHDKREAYRRAGVPEYLVWRVLDEELDWFRLQEGEYVRIEPDENGLIESSTFPGLRLAVAKLLAGDMAAVLAALDEASSG